jgi:hypothetical protein
MKTNESLSESWKTAIRRTLIVTGIASSVFCGAAVDYNYAVADKAVPNSPAQAESIQNGRMGLAGLACGLLLLTAGFKTRRLQPSPKPQ